MKRLTVSASASAAVLAAGVSLFCPAAPASAVTVQRVTPADLGPGRSWIRLQDDPSNAGRLPGTQEVSPFADPVRFNGSLHLAIGPGRQSQAAHRFPRPIPLATIAAAELSYDSYVDSARSTATGTAANLQLPMVCRGGFTTLSFQPQLATDSHGRTGVVPDTWQHFVSSAASRWRTSRAVPGVPTLPAGTDAPLSTYLATCVSPGDGVAGVIANVGTLGSPTATLDTFVDNLTVNGTVHDFTVNGLPSGRISLRDDPAGPTCRPPAQGCQAPIRRGHTPIAGQTPATGGAPAGGSVTARGAVTFTDPANGPDYRDVGVRLVFTARSLAAGDLRVTAAGRPVRLTHGPDNTLTGSFAPSPSTNLQPGGTFTVPITVTATRPIARTGPLTLTAHLLARGYDPLQPTGVQTHLTQRG